MSIVYFKKLDKLDESINEVIYEMLKEYMQEEKVIFDENVPLKVHFGEKGNETYIKSKYMDGIKKYLKENGKKISYIETNVLYKGERTFTDSHIALAKEHGFSDLDIIIADGAEENAYEEVEVNLKNFKTCKIGSKFKNYKNFVVISHFKGHTMAGFGGAIKQLAMGFASRAGKMHQHSQSIPIINEDKCIACRICENKCPVRAISVDEYAKISEEKCIGCASCTPVCPVNAITNTWESSNFHEKLAEYAYAATKGKTNIYVQYAFDITKDCDCHGIKMNPIAPNIGVFISNDPVAIDSCAFDLFKKMTNNDSFDSAIITLDHAEKIGLGTKKYEMKEF